MLVCHHSVPLQRLETRASVICLLVPELCAQSGERPPDPADLEEPLSAVIQLLRLTSCNADSSDSGSYGFKATFSISRGEMKRILFQGSIISEAFYHLLNKEAL